MCEMHRVIDSKCLKMPLGDGVLNLNWFTQQKYVPSFAMKMGATGKH